MQGIVEQVTGVFLSDVANILGFLIVLVALLGVVYTGLFWGERRQDRLAIPATIDDKEPGPPKNPAFEGIEIFERGGFEEAREVLLRAFAKDPHNAETLVGLALSSYELGDLDQAEKYYALALEINPESAKAFREHVTFRV